RACAFVFPAIWAILFLTFQAPGVMVMIGGVASALILLIVVYAAVIMHRKWVPRELKGGQFYKTAFLLSSIAIIAVAVISSAKALKLIG
ncbi:MAG: hypothetical protein NZ804_09565, partial [Roseibacillus sp.]|nr:hypothetical protein [Roseibacillus sp.]